MHIHSVHWWGLRILHIQCRIPNICSLEQVWVADEESSVECDVVSDTAVDESLEEPVSEMSVQGRLRSHSEFWISELDPSQFVKDVVQTGYRLPFVNLPEPCCRLNHRSAY